jgi:hypothetical protein
MYATHKKSRRAFVTAFGWQNDEGFHFSILIEDTERGNKRTLGSFLVATREAAEVMIAQKLAGQGFAIDTSQIVWR